ncbi:MAG: hypothetical protein JWO78_2071 [Micavibrio sp.]|nr:hypothetical protein [Micavibrio sp.]
MKQICFARNTDDISALLGQAEALMSAMRSNPDKDDVYSNNDTSTLSAASVLIQPTAVKCHTKRGQQAITLMPDPSQSIDSIISGALHNSPGPSSSDPSSPKIIKGMRG